MIVDVTGFGWSGSGAVHDLLREYDDVHFASFADFEFTLLWMVDGIADLEYKLCDKHCRYGDSDRAISRFLDINKKLENTNSFGYKELFKGNYYNLCKQYIEDLTQVEFEARNFDDVMSSSLKERLYIIKKNILGRLLNNRIVSPLMWKMFHRNIIPELAKPNTHLVRLSYNPDHFIERTHKLIEELFTYLRTDDNVGKPMITDQLLPPDCPDRFVKYVGEPMKCIVVKRDPRDLFLLTKHAYNSIIPIPTKRVEDFIVFYKKTIEETIMPDNDWRITIDFEDLVYDYEKAVNRISDFIGISSHLRVKQFFDPNKSVQNTQLFNYYDNCEKEIKQIEEALPNSLYPFEKFEFKAFSRKNIY